MIRKPLPYGWEVLLGVDTGTYMSAMIWGVCPAPLSLYGLEEFPNYRYVGNEPELLGQTVSEWSKMVVKAARTYLTGHTKIHAWADPNTQFRVECAHYDLVLRPNFRKLELRVEIAREYQQASEPQRLFLAPWLTVLPYEMEHAKWPEEHTTAGKYERVKQNDHTLDCFEHVASRRPRTKTLMRKEKESFLDKFRREHGVKPRVIADLHLGAL